MLPGLNGSGAVLPLPAARCWRWWGAQGLRSRRVASPGATGHCPVPQALGAWCCLRCPPRCRGCHAEPGETQGRGGNLLKQANCRDSPFPNVSRFGGERSK